MSKCLILNINCILQLNYATFMQFFTLYLTNQLLYAECEFCAECHRIRKNTFENFGHTFPLKHTQLPSWQSPQLLIGEPGFEAHLAKTAMYASIWHLVHVKSVLGAMQSKFPSKLYLWEYQSGGAIPRTHTHMHTHINTHKFLLLFKQNAD